MTIPAGQYGLIYADPPWQYVMRSDKGYEKSPQAHYDCMSLDLIEKLRDDLLFRTAPHCVLFMWAVWPMLPQALKLMAHWGFEYKTGGAWGKVTKNGKQAFGTGYIFRSASEPFILGTIGAPKIKNRSTRNQVYTGDVPADLNELGISIDAMVREHSRKPDQAATMLEELFDGPYLELFARTQRPGWTVWGNQTEKFS